MKVATGKVVGGKVVLEGVPLSEGSIVTVLAQEDDETFDVNTGRGAGAACGDGGSGAR